MLSHLRAMIVRHKCPRDASTSGGADDTTGRADMDKPTESDLRRFWAKVNKLGPADCWTWTAATDPRGYGRFGYGGRSSTVLAHRFSLSLHLGRPVDPECFVCHHCDNPPCINPSHLYEGTHQSNVDDMTSQLRHTWGEANGRGKLSADDVQSIRALVVQGVSQSEVARRHGVNQSTVSRIAARRRWPLLT